MHLAATPQRAGEPSWHRRARRQRGDARAWVRVAAASRLLQAHHAAQRHVLPARSTMPNGASRGKGAAYGGGKGGKGGGSGGKGGGTINEGPQWDCHTCGLPGNFGWRLRCRGCDAVRRIKGPNSTAAAAADTNKGGQQQSLAERQVRQMRDEHRKQRLAAEEENKQLREALTRMRTEAAGRRNKGSEEDEDEGDGEEDELDSTNCPYSSWTEDERQRRLEEARGALAYFTSKYGEDSEQAANTRDEIAAVQRASRGAKPFKAHRGLLERKRERLRDKQARDEAEVAKVSAELEALEAKQKALRSAIEERAKQITDVEGELAELVRKALAEGAAAGDAGRGDEEGGAPWSAQAATVTLQNMASKPGVPPEFAALLEHVFRAAQALANAAATTQPATTAAAASTTASSAKAEGSESSGHRSGAQQQQQQPQQQRQPQHPAAAAVPCTGTGKAAAEGGGKGNLSGAAIGPLAPQGRWGKEAGGGAGSGSRNQQQQHQADGDAMQVDTVGAAEGRTTAGGEGNRDDGSEELLEEEAIGSGIDEGVTESINKLPMADQRKLKAALGARGGRRRISTTAAEGERKEDAPNERDRERSPRPTKGGAGQEGL